MKEMKSILIVDDEESIRVSLKRMLEKDNFQVVTASNGSEALKLLKHNHQDIVLTDIMMEDFSGIKLLQSIKKKYSNVVVLLMTGYASIDSAIEALRLGATDYILKPCSKNKILSSIRNSIKKDFSHKIKNKDQELMNTLKVVGGKRPLTKKELLVCDCLLHGLKSDEMASNLNVTLPTIKFHLKNIYSKLGISGRREIIKVIQDS